MRMIFLLVLLTSCYRVPQIIHDDFFDVEKCDRLEKCLTEACQKEYKELCGK